MSENGDGVRAFFALVPDEDAADFLKGRRSELKRALPEAPIRWVRPENLHLTLRFLGKVKPEAREELVADARNTLADTGSFSFRIGSPGLFPNRRRPVVIAADVEENETLGRLAEMLERSAIRYGLEADRFGFRPHITLGRIQRGSRIRQLPGAATERAEWIADEVVLMRSELTESGPLYSPVHRFPLGRT